MVENGYEDISSDEQPSMEVSPPATDGSSNGSAADPKRAGLGQLMVGGEDSNYFDLAKEMIRAPGNLDEMMARGRYTAQEAAAMVDILTEADQYQQGHIDTSRVVWLKMGFSVGVEGRGREDAIRASIGTQSWKASLQSMGDRIFGNRSQNNGTGQRDGPS